MPLKYTKLLDGASYICRLCFQLKPYSDYTRKVRSGSRPLVCAKCYNENSSKRGEVNELMRLDGKNGKKAQFAARMRKDPTPAKAIFLELMRSHKIAIRHQTVIAGFIADFTLPKKCIVIEVDGEYHNSADQTAYDAARAAALNRNGFRVIRVTNDEVFTSPLVCVERVRAAIAMPRLMREKKAKISQRAKLIAEGRVLLGIA